MKHRHSRRLMVTAAVTAIAALTMAVPTAAGAAPLTPASAATVASFADAEAGGHYVDIVLTQGKGSCKAANVPVTAAPPGRVKIDADDVDLNCSGSIDFSFTRDSTFTFDDAKGTATADVVRIVGRKHGVSCGYEATRVALGREGATRQYTGGPYTGKKAQGSFLCPRTVKLHAASFTFHQ
ncbi:hypothetical protein K3N28_22195 [Glycomyces sp. TRM65418]|uniref:hypothetical protein n=1 Tax=Glycomyces sp. TRM65418 TaxID=2867006 RepID=UPI001CE528C5|nr:hypothetical protein [Glycomyces sp. TRM65418]MCC3765775.1 hypothetical protein [Glycomyces sp. TRM65418]QZD55365.1 hypothetical protein K3N28_22075 [Glycomyces sp. TRM65418]